MEYLVYFGLLPVIFLLADAGILFYLRRDMAAQVASPPFQFWLQDLLLLSLGVALALYLGFDKENWVTMFLTIATAALGFVAAADFCSAYKGLKPGLRAVVFLLVLAGFVLCVSVASMLWFLWKRLHAWLIVGEPCSSFTAIVPAAAVALVYGVAFVLPMDDKVVPVGYLAYLICFEYFFRETRDHSLDVLRWVWLANPCFWMGLAFMLEGRRRLAFVFALLAAGLALIENGNMAVVKSPAYGTWFFSMVLLAVLIALGMIAKKRNA